MTLPDPEDPEFMEALHVLRAQLLVASCVVLGFVCLVIAWLT